MLVSVCFIDGRIQLHSVSNEIKEFRAKSPTL
jgi:hypothetical protein